MKNFFAKHSYNMVKMFLNQFVTALFGFSLVLAAGYAKSPLLRNLSSGFAVLFYLFLLYTMTWEIGFRDKIPSEKGRMRRNPFTGALISLCANLPNLILAILITLAHFVPAMESAGVVSVAVAAFLEGMYTGLMVNQVAGAAISSYWFTYFIIILPSVLVSGLSYWLGLRDLKFTKLFDPIVPESDREPKKKREHDDHED